MTASVDAASPIPVTLVAGFLGAGKTTLINNLLRNAEGLRLAVLVNDFGAINIDAELIDGAADEVVALKNGCICCSLTGGLLAALSAVLRRPDRPDAIIIEGSGVSDPFEIIRALSDRDLQPHAPLEGVVTVVDASEVLELHGDALALSDRQICAADIVLLNKAELVDATRMAAVQERLVTLRPGARLVRCSNAQVPLALVLGQARSGLGAFSIPASAAYDAFESHVVEQSHPIALERLHDLLSQLSDQVFRVKGVVHLVERPEARCILQATGRRATITLGAPWDDERPASRIAFVAAKGALDHAAIEERLATLPPNRAAGAAT